jgi:hypothetical protein
LLLTGTFTYLCDKLQFIYNDIINYMYLLSNDLTFVRSYNFTPPNDYTGWKQSEHQEIIQRHGYSSNLPQLSIPMVTLLEEAYSSSARTSGAGYSGSGVLVNLYVKQAQGLAAKEKAGFSNPYVVVSTIDGRVFQSEVVQRNLNPSWRFSVTLWVSDLMYLFIEAVHC